MIRTVDLRGRALSKSHYNLELPRATLNVAEAMILIQPILDRVKNGTEADLIALAQEFDGVTPARIRVPQQALDKALSELAPAIRSALELSISRVKKGS
jgi:histidinol dehydrogenase